MVNYFGCLATITPFRVKEIANLHTGEFHELGWCVCSNNEGMDCGLVLMNDRTVNSALLLVMSDERNIQGAGGDASTVVPERNGGRKGCDVRGRRGCGERRRREEGCSKRRINGLGRKGRKQGECTKRKKALWYSIHCHIYYVKT